MTPTPTDPMTPVRDLIEANAQWWRDYNPSSRADVLAALENATASISQLLSEHDKVVALIAEWHAKAQMDCDRQETVTGAAVAFDLCADMLAAAIVEGK